MLQESTQPIKKPLLNKFTFVIGVLIILVVILFIHSILLRKQITSLNPTKTTGTEPKDNGVETVINYTPIAWALSNDSLIIQYNNTVYEENNPGGQGIKLTEWEQSHPNTQWQWITKLQFISNEHVIASIFDLKHFPDKSGFVLVTYHGSSHQINPTSGISYYNVYFIFPDNHIYSGDYPALQLTSVGSNYSSQGYSVPVIDSISPDSKAVAFKLYGCWGCGGHYPEFLVSAIPLNSDNYGRDIENIGYVKQYPSTFVWENNGSYSFTPFPEECAKLSTEDFATNPNAEKDCLNKYPQTPTIGKLKL